MSADLEALYINRTLQRNVWRERRQPADERRKLLQEPADVLMVSPSGFAMSPSISGRVTLIPTYL